MGEAPHKPLLPLYRLVQLGDRLLHLRCHGVEIRRHRPDFVLRQHWRTAGKTAGGDGAGRLAQPRQRPGQGLGHGVGQRRAQQNHHAENPQIGLLLILAGGVERGDIVGGLEVQHVAAGFHRAVQQQIPRAVRVRRNIKQAAARLGQLFALQEAGRAGLHAVQRVLLRAQAQRRPPGPVLLVELVHGLGQGVAVQVGVQAVDNLKGRPHHAAGGEGGLLFPLQSVLEGLRYEQAPPCAEEHGQQRQHTQGHFNTKFHSYTSSR